MSHSLCLEKNESQGKGFRTPTNAYLTIAELAASHGEAGLGGHSEEGREQGRTGCFGEGVEMA